MNFKRSIVATLVCASLAACGGSGSSSVVDPTPAPSPEVTPAPVTTSLTAKAADGYLIGANACLDLNNNKECDAGEPSATTGNNGEFTIEGVTQAQIDSAGIVVEIIKDVTIDKDNPNVKLAKSYKLTAPAGSDFISPISTLIQNEIDKGSSLKVAQEAVKEKLGTTQDITKDYIEGKESTELSAQDKAEFASLHRIAQVTAKVIANNTDTLKQVAQDNQISVEKLTSLIIEEVNKALKNIVQKVEMAEDSDEDFDSDSLAKEIDDEHIDLNDDNVGDKVKENEAAKVATAANLGELIKNEGIHWFSGEKHPNQAVELDYGKLKLEANGTVIQMEYNLNDAMDGFELNQKAQDEANLQRMLTADGWVAEDDTIVSVTINEDGSIELVTKTPALNEKVSAKQVDISELNIATVMSKVSGNGAWAKVLPKDKTFPSNTMAYQLKSEKTLTSYFGFNAGDWCDENRKTALNGMCNGVESQGVWAEKLDSFMVETEANRDGSKDNSNLFPMMGTSNGGILVEMVKGGKLNFYKTNWSDGILTKVGSGTWRDITVYGQALRELTLPGTIASRDDLTWNNFSSEDHKAYFAVVEGYVRNIWKIIPDQVDGEYVFNQATQELILSQFDYKYYHPTTLASCLASLPDNGYQLKVGDVFTYKAQKQKTNETSVTQYNERFELVSQTASWPHNDNKVTGLPQWITDTAGKLELTLWSGQTLDGKSVGYEENYSKGSVYYGHEGVDSQGEFANWGAAKVAPIALVGQDKMKLNQTNDYSFATFNIVDLYNAAPDSSFEELSQKEFEFSETYQGKYTVNVPAGSFDTCKVISKAKEKGSSLAADSDIIWRNNRGMVMQEQNNPSWAPVYNRQATSLPN
ncbi:hypothetical protein K6Y31_06640 [Motilimonas cestriensis]|uniref:Lipoprotein n=1 Tax=Motilimonas cestriensis TaxID=2742685 RepID=A0ABS8W676_9GAMM|nr:hypothetical protein [Motilimonas cestriensis]MCE2594487.1 hypothetical protein [Motilimonas cestriensis]